MRDFKELFSGYEYAYGKYDVSNAGQRERDKKLEGKAITVAAAAPTEAWEKHRQGVLGLGVIPLKSDDTISFFAIDIDKYEDVRDEKGVKFVRDHTWPDLPLVFCRSKSGGLHAYGFLAEPVLAADYMNTTIKWIAEALGYPDAEIFPKQIARTNKYVDAGNWINLPYYGETRRAINPETGEEFPLEEFVRYANANLITVEMLESFEKPPTPETVKVGEISINPDDYVSDKGIFGDGPPCLQSLVLDYVNDADTPERNNFLFNVGVYGYRRTGSTDGAIEMIRKTNGMFKAPLTDAELAESLCAREGIKYAEMRYTCRKSPIQGACKSSLCKKRAFGFKWPESTKKATAGNVDTSYIRGIRILKYQTPIVLVDVNGISVDFRGGEELFSLQNFRARVFNSTHMVVPITQNQQFLAIISELMQRAEKIEVEDPILNEVADILTLYLSQRETGETDNTAIASGAAVVQPDGRFLINLKNFTGYMKSQYGKVVDDERLFAFLKDSYRMKLLSVPMPGKRPIQGALLEYVASE